MSKELPWFKFKAATWLLGNISDEQEKVQGQFIRVCAIYWDRNCDITMQELNKKVHKTKLKGLINLGYIEEENDKVCIPFLDEQWIELSTKHTNRQTSGKKGGEAKAKQSSSNGKAMVKQSSSILDIDIDIEVEEDIDIKKKEREDSFKKQVFEHSSDKYSDKMLNDFFFYWSESNEGGKKMRYQMQKVFDITRRLATWISKEKEFSTNKTVHKSPHNLKNEPDYSEPL